MIHHSSIAGCPKISGQAVIPDTRVDGRGQGREKKSTVSLLAASPWARRPHPMQDDGKLSGDGDLGFA
jgi:hypothetical protein